VFGRGITTFAAFKGYSVSNKTDKPYRDGGRFEISEGERKKGFFEVVDNPVRDSTGKWNKGVKFTNYAMVDKEYRTVFGPVFSSSVQMYKQDGVGLAGAVTRLTCAREADRSDYHEYLRWKQFQNVGKSHNYTRWEEHFIRTYRSKYPILLEDEGREEWSFAKHIKRALRIATFSIWSIYLFARSRTWVFNKGDLTFRDGRVNYKMKGWELLAPGKYLRAIGDLGPAGAMLGGFMFDSVKDALTEPFYIGRMKCYFVKKPEHDALVKAFRDILETEDMTLVCFSDDAMIGIRCSDGIYWANLDISACDGSIFDPIFNMLRRGMLGGGLPREAVEKVFAQCSAECKVRNVWDKKKGCPEFFVLKPRYMTLYSGHGGTTSVDTCANVCNFISIAESLVAIEDRLVEDMPDVVVKACEEVGFIVRVDKCEVVEDLQFLKNSPTYVNGKLCVFVNLGVMMRGFGMSKGDLPVVAGQGKYTLEDRAAAFTSDVVKSFVHYGNHIITEAMRTKIVKNTTNWVPNEYDVKLTGKSDDIPFTSLCKRYRLEPKHLFELETLIIASGFENAINCPAVQNIFTKDYGYPAIGCNTVGM